MEYVWVKCDTEDDIGLAFGACIVERLRNRYKIRDDNGNESYVKYSDLLRPMHPSCIKDVDDMILLGDVQEYTILRNLELRYMKNLIYTYTGNILIAVNPYQTLPIYGEEIVKLYRGRKLGELPPHLFAIGDASYENMRINNEKQCIIITGESGAGKTQSAKLLLHHYAAITGKHSEIKERILESNTILEGDLTFISLTFFYKYTTYEACVEKLVLKTSNNGKYNKADEVHFGSSIQRM